MPTEVPIILRFLAILLCLAAGVLFGIAALCWIATKRRGYDIGLRFRNLLESEGERNAYLWAVLALQPPPLPTSEAKAKIARHLISNDRILIDSIATTVGNKSDEVRTDLEKAARYTDELWCLLAERVVLVDLLGHRSKTQEQWDECCRELLVVRRRLVSSCMKHIAES